MELRALDAAFGLAEVAFRVGSGYTAYASGDDSRLSSYSSTLFFATSDERCVCMSLRHRKTT